MNDFLYHRQNRRIGRIAAALLLITPAAILAPARSAADSADARLVRIAVNRLTYDAVHPWRTSKPMFQFGYGIQIDQQFVLTSEHLVRNHTLVEIERPRSAVRIPVDVHKSDPSLNLALLRLPSLPTRETLALIDIADAAPLGSEMQVLQLDDVRDFQAAPSQVQQIRVGRMQDSPTSLLVYSLLCRLNVNGEGAPVMTGEQLAGIIVAFDQSTRIATMVAAPFVKRFVDDAREPPYQGVASAGFTWKPLVDPVKRDYLKLEGDNGILILGTMPGTGADETLRSMDALLEWDGRGIDRLGFYQDDTFGRLDFSHLIKAHGEPGQRIQITIQRDGQRLKQELELSGDLDQNLLVPENVANERAEYIVAGGYVLRELDMQYLYAHGAKWRASVDSRLMNYYLAARQSDRRATDRVVIVTDLLSDAINEGYGDARNGIVTAVNGQTIRNLDDVFRIHETDGGIYRLSLKAEGVDIVFDRGQLAAANRRIAEQYRIPALSYRRQ